MPGDAITSEVVGPPSGPERTPAGGVSRLGPIGFDWHTLARVARPLPLLVAGAWLLHHGDRLPDRVVEQTDRERGIVEALRARGLVAREDDVHFVTPTRPWVRSPVERERAFVRAVHPGEPGDIYLVDVRRAPEGHLIDVSGVYNLSDTSAADEQKLVVTDDRAAWVIVQEGAVSSVQLADVRGEARPEGAEWTRLARAQEAITNFQETGQTSGVGRRSFKLEPPAYQVVLGLSPGALNIDADAHKIRIPLRGGGAIEGARWVKDQTPQKARPGNFVTWAVDRVRALPWFGDENLAFVKAVAFEGVDQFEQIVNTVTGDDGSAAVAEELGQLYAAPGAGATDPETGWPPPPLEPMLDPPLKGEGKWVSLEGDPFVLKNPESPSPFVFSFIRSDRKRIYSQVFITLWDPRQVELNTVSGTVEPRSATGETGPGIVPRDPRVLGRFVAAFNGGFQAVHGEFGLMADRTVYLPPKPYGATVAKLADGSTGFGTWPEDEKIPDGIVSYRQNMTPLVVDDAVNPYKRHWWGGVPPGWTEESRTVRSGVCMTKEGFAGYFYGGSVDPDVLALAMHRARCTYGVHLDMNAGHTGLEFYRVGPAGSLPVPKRPLDEMWEARGPMPDMPGWEFLGRRMIKYMALMNFPRYVHAESRDFFYLTLRHLLPGPPAPTVITPPEEGEGAWRTQGLPQHGWPHVVATTNMRPDATRPFTRVGLIKLDPKYLRVERPGDVAPRRILEFRSVLAEGKTALWHSETTGFAIGKDAPDAKALRITAGIPAATPEALRAQAAVGIDPTGMLIYARVTEGPEPGRDGALLLALLARLGCEASVLLLPRPLGAVLRSPGEASAGLGAPEAPALASPKPPAMPLDPTLAPGSTLPAPSAVEGVSLVRSEGPGARRIFPETPIVLPKRWAPLQQKRVRYK